MKPIPLEGSVSLFSNNGYGGKMLSEKNDNRRMLTIAETANLLNVHINTIRRWSNTGALKTYRIGNRGDRRFNLADVREMLQQSEVTR